MGQSDRLIRTVTLSLAPSLASPGLPSKDIVALTLPARALPEGLIDLQAQAGTLTVTYDLRHATLPAVECWLAANGLHLSQSVAARLYRRWLAFKDDNRRDQAAIVHQCCSLPPRKE